MSVAAELQRARDCCTSLLGLTRYGCSFESAMSVDITMEDGGDLPNFTDKYRELFRQNRLHAVGERFVGLVMHFDEEAISSHGHRCARKWEDFVTPACAVAGVDQNRQVAALFDCGHDRQIECITGVVGKGAHP